MAMTDRCNQCLLNPVLIRDERFFMILDYPNDRAQNILFDMLKTYGLDIDNFAVINFPLCGPYQDVNFSLCKDKAINHLKQSTKMHYGILFGSFNSRVFFDDSLGIVNGNATIDHLDRFLVLKSISPRMVAVRPSYKSFLHESMIVFKNLVNGEFDDYYNSKRKNQVG